MSPITRYARACSPRACSPRYTRSNMNERSDEHRFADLLALPDLARAFGSFDEVAHECVDASRARRAEQLELFARELGPGQDPVPDRVVDVVVDVRDAIDDADDPALQRRRLELSGMREDPVANLRGEVQLLRDAERLLVVAEAAAEPRAERVVQRLLARVPERRVAGIVPSEIASTRSSFSCSARATTREIADVSRVCVIRVR